MVSVDLFSFGHNYWLTSKIMQLGQGLCCSKQSEISRFLQVTPLLLSHLFHWMWLDVLMNSSFGESWLVLHWSWLFPPVKVNIFSTIIYWCATLCAASSPSSSFAFYCIISAHCITIYSGKVMAPPKYRCGICKQGCGNNSIECVSCLRWIHRWVRLLHAYFIH